MPKNLEVETPETIDNRRKIIIDLVMNGVENDTIECKREWDLKREDRPGQLSFVRLIQSIANTPRLSEGYLVIGADNKNKSFHSISNADAFDPATIKKLLTPYLEPPPAIEVYNNLTTDNGDAFVVIVFSPNQDRPIVLTKEGLAGDVKIRLGEVWVKSGTATALATRRQLDEMYEARADIFAENLARKRFAHFREENEHSRSVVADNQGPPRRDLLLGPRGDLIDYFLRAAESSKKTRLSMLIEMLRDIIVVDWAAYEDSLGTRGFSSNSGGIREYVENSVTPAIIALTEIALLVVKHRLDHTIAGKAIGVLREHFDATSKFVARGSGARSVLDPEFPSWLTCMQCYGGIRCAAIYALTRERTSYLPAIQRHLVTRFSNTLSWGSTPIVPILLAPFRLRDAPELYKDEGMVRYLWESWVRENFGKYFLGFEGYLGGAIKHEAVLEFNSYMGMDLGNPLNNGKARPREDGVDMSYFPEFWHWNTDKLPESLAWIYRLSSRDNEEALEKIMFSSGEKLTWAYTTREHRENLTARFIYSTLTEAAATARQQGHFFFDSNYGITDEFQKIFSKGKALS